MIQFSAADGRSAALERIERDAWLDAYVVAKEQAGAALQAASTLRGGAALMAMRAVDLGVLNRAQGFGCGGPFTVADAEAAVPWLREHCAPDWRFQFVPSSLPPDIEHRASELGLGPKERGPAKLYRGPAPVTSPDPERHTRLTIEKVAPGNAEGCVDVVRTVLGLPPAFNDWGSGLIGRKNWHAYAAFDEGIPVAFGLMFVNSDWAWLGWGVTLASHRGMGAQSAIIRRRVRDGIAIGVRHFATECAAPSDADPNASVSYRNMNHAGFSEAYVRTAFGPL